MKTIKITQENVNKAYKNATDDQKKMIEDLVGSENIQKNIIDRIKTFQDACDEIGVSSNLMIFESVPQESRLFMINTYKASIITKALNESWTPDWTNSSEYKYYPWIDMKTGKYDPYALWRTKSPCSSRLSFRTPELAKYAATQFQEVWSGMMRG